MDVIVSDLLARMLGKNPRFLIDRDLTVRLTASVNQTLFFRSLQKSDEQRAM